MDYVEALTLNDISSSVEGENWQARVINDPDPANTDRVCYMIDFRLRGRRQEQRTLKAWASDAGLYHDADGAYRRRLLDTIQWWLRTGARAGEIECFN